MTQTPKTSGDLAPRARARIRQWIRPRGLAFAAAFSLLLSGRVVRAQRPKPIEPTPEQLQEAIKTATALGGDFRQRIYPQTQQVSHVLILPRSTTDGDLTKIPDLPFSFGVDVFQSNVTDAGL